MVFEPDHIPMASYHWSSSKTIFQIEPVNEMFGDNICPRHVWTPQWHRLVILVKQMVVALIVVETCIKPQHRLSNLCGIKKNEELRDTYKNRDKKITMVPSTQQSSEKFSRFVLQQQKLQQHVYALCSYDNAAHKFISDNPKLDFSGFELSCYDYRKVYVNDSFFDPIK